MVGTSTQMEWNWADDKRDKWSRTFLTNWLLEWECGTAWLDRKSVSIIITQTIKYHSDILQPVVESTVLTHYSGIQGHRSIQFTMVMFNSLKSATLTIVDTHALRRSNWFWHMSALILMGLIDFMLLFNSLWIYSKSVYSAKMYLVIMYQIYLIYYYAPTFAKYV